MQSENAKPETTRPGWGADGSNCEPFMQARIDDALRGRPKLLACTLCGGSREDQVRTSYYTVGEHPLCKRCWEVEYNDGKTDVDP